MAHGKNEPRHLTRRDKRRRQLKKQKLQKTVTLMLSLLVIMVVAIGGTLAYLSTKTAPVNNSFTPSSVSCNVNETFDGTTKSNVNVTNTGDTEAYIRVKLVTYRVNDKGQHIGGTAAIPEFTPGSEWVKYNGFYYYIQPVSPNEKPATDLISSITLAGSYTDADGGKQVIEVMAEAIQSDPASAVGNAWGVSISNGSVTDYQS